LAIGRARAARPAAVAAVLGACAVASAVVVLVVGRSSFDALAEARATLASPDRADAWAAAARAFWRQPVVGTGPGRLHLGWVADDGVPQTIEHVHNEYLQLLAELGVVGGILLGGVLASSGLAVWRAVGPGAAERAGALPRADRAGAAAGLVALAVGSALDFSWHTWALLVLAGLLIGVAAGRPVAAIVQ
jgi:O-antigen ligase